MIDAIILFLALLCQNHNHTVQNHGNCPLVHTTMETQDDTTGETGNFPPKPPAPQPPPPPGG